MATLNKTDSVSRPVSPANFRHEDIMVAFLIERFRQLSKESFSDIVSLVEAITSPGTPVEEQYEIFETIREILFPELVGDIHMGRAGSVEETPNRLQRRMDHVGSTIKRKREEKKLTQMELAKLSGLPQSHICRLEAGVHSPSMKTLEKIARALGVAVGDLDPSN
jgi:DNA-binding XRE family transcriptional regulator